MDHVVRVAHQPGCDADGLAGQRADQGALPRASGPGQGEEDRRLQQQEPGSVSFWVKTCIKATDATRSGRRGWAAAATRTRVRELFMSDLKEKNCR